MDEDRDSLQGLGIVFPWLILAVHLVPSPLSQGAKRRRGRKVCLCLQSWANTVLLLGYDGNPNVLVMLSLSVRYRSTCPNCGLSLE